MLLRCLSEASVSDAAFNQRAKTQKVDIGKLLGFSQPLNMVAHGSFATLYNNPGIQGTLIKVTSHKEDVQNTIKAQRLKSQNIVKTFEWASGEMAKKLPSIKSWALQVERVNGKPLQYSTGHFYALAYNGNFELAKDWLDYGGSDEQKKILRAYNTLHASELVKLSQLFESLHGLSRLGIDISDFEDNILDSGDRYVIIDLGF